MHTRSLICQLLLFAWLGIAVADARADEPVSYSLTPESSAAVAIKKTLNDKASLEFIESPLTDVIEFLKNKHGIEIQLDNRALQEASLDASTVQITRNLKEVSLRSALRLLLRDLDLTFVIRDEVMLITTTTAAHAMEEIRVYPVADLVYRSEADRQAGKYPDFDSLKNLILANVYPTAWGEGNDNGMKEGRNPECLVFSQTAACHEEVGALLTTLRLVRKSQPPIADALKDDGALQVRVYRLNGRVHYPSAGAGVLTVVEDSVEQATKVMKMIPELIEPASWKGAGGEGSVHTVGSAIVVRQTNAIHRQVKTLIDELNGQNY